MPVYEKVVDLPSPPTLSSTITYCATSSMISGLISAREYFDLKILDENSDNFKHMIWKSVDIESVSTFGDEVAEVVDAFEKELPSNRAVVRAWNYLGGIRVEKVVGGEECLVYYIIRSDLKGSLSSWLVNQGMVGAITSIFSSISAALEN
ncbi:hypothetical protein HK098_007441 [Nowakowskiella sp. JEL0407]|nr:hypothetical protein HK098_007441 [Nowakowskiella sp. JEL0407]